MATNPDRTQNAQNAAQEEAEHVAGKTQDAAQQTADTAMQEARQVAGEATDQVKSLASSLQDEAFSQAGTQQQRLAEQSRTVTNDLQRLARGEKPEAGLVSQTVSMLAERAEQFTSQLENKEPADLLKDVRRFAARRPVAFLAIAAGIGVAAGRLTRGLTDSDDDSARVTQSQPSQTTSRLTGNPSTVLGSELPSVPSPETSDPGISPNPGTGAYPAPPASGYPDPTTGEYPGGVTRGYPDPTARGYADPTTGGLPADESGGRHLRDFTDPEERR
ncbi:hypothetical protein [Corynebacterium halotolerans]|uniref:hypothetical protein n=1 Tax=Corynebacterium halotolerans TaxID=225326 RepID=UPI003CF61190